MSVDDVLILQHKRVLSAMRLVALFGCREQQRAPPSALAVSALQVPSERPPLLCPGGSCLC